MRGLRVGEQYVLLARVGGRYRAIDDQCNHAGCLLSGGRLEGSAVVCPCHEIAFDLHSGRNLTSPRVCGDQRAYRLSEAGGELVIDLLPPTEGSRQRSGQGR
ncbi:MAG: Rieske 2Fe-2S domain-containing protein [Myxococcales bacterium]|nr:Rieske 2Fe-2S domain-containing protein [Myxococcales bacterium]